MLDAVDEKDKVTGDTDNQFEDTLKENDLLGNGVLGNVEIISNSTGRVINSRCLILVFIFPDIFGWAELVGQMIF